MKTLIELNQVNLSLNNGSNAVSILHDICLTVYENETLAIVGASGSGKTSLLMLIAGLERASSGDVVVKGKRLNDLNEDALARFRAANIGIVFQSFHLIPTMTALENVAIPLEFLNVESPMQKAQAALTSLGLGHRLHHLPSALSGGEQQRVALARAFIANPTLILADEPTGNLDKETGKQVMDILFAIHEQESTALIFITHDEQLAARCKRQIRLSDGCIQP